MNGNNNTLDRIQKEIKESLERDNELRKLYNGKVENNETNNNEVIFNGNGTTNGVSSGITNGVSPLKQVQKTNGVRLFTQNTNPTRGLMKTFFKTRGKVNAVTKFSSSLNKMWTPEDYFNPTKVNLEKGKPIRKGFVSAEEKMKQELMDFKKREEDLRRERRKSQPDIMAALSLEEELDEAHLAEKHTFPLKSAKSLSNLYSDSEDVFQDSAFSAPCSLKPSSRNGSGSAALLCDMLDYRDEIPGTHSLIKQFENLKSQDRT
ncbi:unnamed protein product [Brassicogethes aeneus]|uniref:A-kinase anchor protein 2 C-terminal domain-containing protein n=1 Tax=Brassicogethes aeneus TaxID=1431903 RepID=A0A9P0FLP8_BRAAE|nr:unnamed protein product [Brassicogethes aeneus]